MNSAIQYQYPTIGFMPRIARLVRTATLRSNLKDGLIDKLVLVETSDGFKLAVYYKRPGSGEPIKYLTTYRNENNERTFTTLDSAWRYLQKLRVKTVLITTKGDKRRGKTSH